MGLSWCGTEKELKAQIDELKDDLRHANINVEEKSKDAEYLQLRLQKLEVELKQNKKNADKLQQEKNQLKNECDQLLDEKQALINKLKQAEAKPAVSSEDELPPKNPTRTRREGIKPSIDDQLAPRVSVKHIEKPIATTQKLRAALKSCDMLRTLPDSNVDTMVNSMVKEPFDQHQSIIIKEGDKGEHLYIILTGAVEVELTNGPKLIKAPYVFGEIALIYNTPRTCTIRGRDSCELWSLRRAVFDQIMRDQDDHIDRSAFLRQIPLLRALNDYDIAKIAHVADDECYESGQYIVRQFTKGTTFYIIMSGKCHVMKAHKDAEQCVGELERGDFFGELALVSSSTTRQASILAVSRVTVLAIDHADVERLIGDPKQIASGQRERRSKEMVLLPLAEKALISRRTDPGAGLNAADFHPEATLGEGGFGKVELVRHKHKQSQYYARKKISKKHATDVELETKIMQNEELNNFIDGKFIYMFMEPCLGGELWISLKANKRFNESRTQFYVACIIEAIEFLHERSIVYRDIKPENILIDKNGFAKLADFGLARQVRPGTKRYTCCGTPEYMAPEVLLKYGHDLSVDYWAIGILIYELASGGAPFNGPQESIKGNIRHNPSKLSKKGCDLIKALVQTNPSKRLGNFKNGIADIRHHRFFQSFDWIGLRQRTVTPPWVPRLDSDHDTKYFTDELSLFTTETRKTKL